MIIIIKFNNQIYYKIQDSELKDYYYISKNGSILSVFGGKFKILKPRTDKDGYLNISLVKNNGARSPKRVHRLVAKTFLSNQHDYPIVNHKNGVKLDNHVNNLEWCTISYNTKHGYDKLGVICARQKIIKSTDIITGISWIHESIKDAGIFYNIDGATISRKLSGETPDISTRGKLKNIVFEFIGYANVTTIENTSETRK